MEGKQIENLLERFTPGLLVLGCLPQDGRSSSRIIWRELAGIRTRESQQILVDNIELFLVFNSI